MKQLTQPAFQKAKNFIMEHGRALDQRRFEYHFENGSADAVLAALAPYQNDDGGFAHSLGARHQNTCFVCDCNYDRFPDSQRNTGT